MVETKVPISVTCKLVSTKLEMVNIENSKKPERRKASILREFSDPYHAVTLRNDQIYRVKST